MILSDRSIRLNKIVKPCEVRGKFRGMSYGLSSCGYDARVDLAQLPVGHRTVSTPDGQGIILPPGKGALLGLREHFSVPPGVAGYTRDKSTWARRGLLIAQAVLEPGWRGFMALRVFNAGDEDLVIIDGEPLAQIIFHWIDRVPDRTYSGKYQGQERGPQGPRYEE